MPLKTTKWDVLDYLTAPADRMAYLEAALEDGDPDVLAMAIRDVIRAAAGNETLHSMLGDVPGEHDLLDFATATRVMKALGYELSFRSTGAHGRRPRKTTHEGIR